MGPGLIPRPLAIGIAVVITGVWAASQLGTLFVEGYEAPDAIHAALMIVLGAVFALRRAEDDDTDDEQPDPPPERPAPQPAPVPAPTPEPEPIPPGRESAADMIARLQQERNAR